MVGIAGFHLGKYSSLRLHPEMIRPPIPRPLLDLVRAGDLTGEHGAGEIGELLVAGEAEGDELAGAEVADVGLEVRREEALQPQGLFEADDTVLRLQREGAEIPGEQPQA